MAAVAAAGRGVFDVEACFSVDDARRFDAREP
jgi:hypothetical protein